MQLKLVIAAALLAAAPLPVAACGLALGTGGVLTLSGDGKTLGSDQLLGVPSTFTVTNGLLDGAATITVSAPTVSAYPPGFNIGGAQASIAYDGAGLLGSVHQGYTTSQSSFQIPGLLSLLVVMTINSRISSPTGFNQGTYNTKTTITCS